MANTRGAVRRRIRSREEAKAALFDPGPKNEPPRTHTLPGGRREHDVLDPDLVWADPGIKVFPFSVKSDPSVFAQVVGQRWVDVTPPKVGVTRKRHGCIYWGLLARDQYGAIVVAELAVAPLYPAALSATMLRSLKVDRIVELARQRILDDEEWLDVAPELQFDLPSPERIEEIKKLGRQAARQAARRGRPGNPPEFYRAFALEALQLQGEVGKTRGLRPILAERRHVEIGTIRDWLRRARDLGYLAPAEGWGVAGFKAGPNLDH